MSLRTINVDLRLENIHEVQNVQWTKKLFQCFVVLMLQYHSLANTVCKIIKIFSNIEFAPGFEVEK